MSIYLTRESRVIVQGITGRMAQFHTKDMLEYGTNVVGGVVPGKGGETVHGVPVFDTVKEAVEAAKGGEVQHRAQNCEDDCRAQPEANITSNGKACACEQ